MNLLPTFMLVRRELLRFIRERSRMIGVIAAAMPNISRLLAMLEPMILPQAMPGALSNAASTLVTSSGIEVPKPTITKPTINGVTRAFSASCTAPRTSSSPPTTRATNPATAVKIMINIFETLFPRSAQFAGHWPVWREERLSIGRIYRSNRTNADVLIDNIN